MQDIFPLSGFTNPDSPNQAKQSHEGCYQPDNMANSMITWAAVTDFYVVHY